jgi:hypothetical protein
VKLNIVLCAYHECFLPPQTLFKKRAELFTAESYVPSYIKEGKVCSGREGGKDARKPTPVFQAAVPECRALQKSINENIGWI